MDSTTEPGCCYGNLDTALLKRWMDGELHGHLHRVRLFAAHERRRRVALRGNVAYHATEELAMAVMYKVQTKSIGLEDQSVCERQGNDG